MKKSGKLPSAAPVAPAPKMTLTLVVEFDNLADATSCLGAMRDAASGYGAFFSAKLSNVPSEIDLT